MTALFTSFHDHSSEPGEWLARAEGFSVECDGRRLGVVEELRFATRVDLPDALIVRGGFLGRRRITVRSADVERVLPREKRLLLRPASRS